MSKVAEYTFRPLNFDQELVDKVTARRAAGESLGAIAKDLKLGLGKTAMAELVGTTDHKALKDPAALARAVVKDRKAGDSWGKIAARYRVTEGTARAAYTAAEGADWRELDYRKGRQEVAA